MVALALPLVVVAVALIRAYREVDEDFVHEWADAHALTLTTANRPLVWWYLRNARVLRTWGVLAALVLPQLAVFALGYQAGDGLDSWWVVIFAGHLAGALYAEVALRRPTPTSRRVASLERREVGQYLPMRLRVAPILVTAMVLVAAAVAWSAGLDSSDARETLVAGAAAVVVTLAIMAAQRWVVRRPQPFAAADLVAADDAIRSQSVHMLAGSGTAVLLSLLGTVCWTVTFAADGATGWIASAVGVLSLPLALVSCLYYGHRAWRVPRGPFLRDLAASS